MNLPIFKIIFTLDWNFDASLRMLFKRELQNKVFFKKRCHFDLPAEKWLKRWKVELQLSLFQSSNWIWSNSYVKQPWYLAKLPPNTELIPFVPKSPLTLPLLSPIKCFCGHRGRKGHSHACCNAWRLKPKGKSVERTVMGNGTNMQ